MYKRQDILFENLFEEEFMCLDEPTRDILVNYTSPGKSVDLSFEEIYETELEFLSIHNEEVPNEKGGGDKFLNNDCSNMRKKHLKKVRLGRKEAKMTKQLASPLCPLKRTHWNDEKRARGIRRKRPRCGRNLMLYIFLYNICTSFTFHFMHLYISFIHWGQCMR